MANCNRCGAETQLYYSGYPICIACSNTPLIEDWRGLKLPERPTVFGRVTTGGRSQLPRDARRV
jgi:hypothetical protein